MFYSLKAGSKYDLSIYTRQRKISLIVLCSYTTTKNSDVSNLATCLINTSNNIARADLPQIGSILPGQIWSPNDQCQMIYGASSSFCQVCCPIYSLIILATKCN